MEVYILMTDLQCQTANITIIEASWQKHIFCTDPVKVVGHWKSYSQKISTRKRDISL